MLLKPLAVSQFTIEAGIWWVFMGPSLFLPSCPTHRDRLRTTTNVLGDSLGAGIVEHLSRHELKNRDVEMGNSVIEENEMKKPYQLIAQDNEPEKPVADSETKM